MSNVRQGYEEEKRLAAEREAKIKEERAQATSELIQGIKENSAERVRRALDKEADLTVLIPSAVSDKSVTPIVYAAEINTRWEMVELIASLRKHQANYGYHDALCLTIKSQQLSAAKALILAGTPLDWNINDGKDKKTVMIIAAETCFWELIEWVAANYSADKNDNQRFGAAMLEASKHGKVGIVSLLAKAGANFGWSSHQDDRRILHIAAALNNTKMLHDILPLIHKGEVNIEDANNDTPFLLACDLKHWECAKILATSKKFEPKFDTKMAECIISLLKEKQFELATIVMRVISKLTVNENFYSILQWGAVIGSQMIPRYILENNLASQISLSKDGKTALEIACESKHWGTARVLIELANNSQFNLHMARQMHYDKSLILAITGGCIEIVELLLQHGANCRRWNSSNGNIALHAALQSRNKQIVYILLRSGSDPFRPNKDGENSIRLAEKIVDSKFAREMEGYLNSNDCKKNFYAPLNTSYISDVLLDYTVEELEIEASRHIKSLQDLAVDLTKSYDVLQHIVKCRRAVLVQDLDELDAQRSLMEQLIKANTKDNPVANLPSEVEITCCAELIRNINLLIKNPNEPMPVEKLKQNKFEAAKHVLSYVHAVKSIDTFKSLINDRIDELLTSLNDTSFNSKHIAGSFWLTGKPVGIRELMKIIAKRSHVDNTEEVFAIYVEILNTLDTQRKVKTYHPETSAFLNRYHAIFAKIDFNFCSEAKPLVEGGVVNFGMYQQQPVVIDSGVAYDHVNPFVK